MFCFITPLCKRKRRSREEPLLRQLIDQLSSNSLSKMQNNDQTLQEFQQTIAMQLESFKKEILTMIQQKTAQPNTPQPERIFHYPNVNVPMTEPTKMPSYENVDPQNKANDHTDPVNYAPQFTPNLSPFPTINLNQRMFGDDIRSNYPDHSTHFFSNPPQIHESRSIQVNDDYQSPIAQQNSLSHNEFASFSDFTTQNQSKDPIDHVLPPHNEKKALFISTQAPLESCTPLESSAQSLSDMPISTSKEPAWVKRRREKQKLEELKTKVTPKSPSALTNPFSVSKPQTRTSASKPKDARQMYVDPLAAFHPEPNEKYNPTEIEENSQEKRENKELEESNIESLVPKFISENARMRGNTLKSATVEPQNSIPKQIFETPAKSTSNFRLVLFITILLVSLLLVGMHIIAPDLFEGFQVSKAHFCNNSIIIFLINDIYMQKNSYLEFYYAISKEIARLYWPIQ